MSDTYQTAGGATVTLGFRFAIAGPVHTIECTGCDGIRGFKTPEAANDAAQKHAANCTKQPAGGAS